MAGKRLLSGPPYQVPVVIGLGQVTPWQLSLFCLHRYHRLVRMSPRGVDEVWHTD